MLQYSQVRYMYASVRWVCRSRELPLQQHTHLIEQSRYSSTPSYPSNMNQQIGLFPACFTYCETHSDRSEDAFIFISPPLTTFSKQQQSKNPIIRINHKMNTWLVEWEGAAFPIVYSLVFFLVMHVKNQYKCNYFSAPFSVFLYLP